MWARQGQDATQASPPPAHDATQEWAQPAWSAPEGRGQQPGGGQQQGWGQQRGWGQRPGQGAPAGWGPSRAPRRDPERTPLVVGAGIALLLVIAVVAVLSLRDSGSQPTASPGTVAPFVPAAGSGGGTSGGGAGGTTGGGGTSGGGGSGALGAGLLRLPDEVGGMARIPVDGSPLLDGQQGLLDMITGSGALDGWGLGAYGPGGEDPRFVLMVVRAEQADTAGLIAGGMVDGVRNSLGGDVSEPKAFTRHGVRYDCFNGSIGSLCSFQDGPTVGIGFGRDTDLKRLSQLTDDARRGVRG